MPKFKITTEGASDVIEADSIEDAITEAEDWLARGWEDVDSTTWVEGYVYALDEDDEKVGDGTRVTATIDPAETKCVDGKGHAWSDDHDVVGGIKENPGVWGHGGGVVIHTACLRCGLGKTVDTWAQNPCTGEQGLESTSYERHEYDYEVTSRVESAREVAAECGREAAAQASDEDPGEWTGDLLPGDIDAIKEARGCEPRPRSGTTTGTSSARRTSRRVRRPHEDPRRQDAARLHEADVRGSLR